MSRGRRIAAPSSTGRSPDDEPLAADEPLAPDDSGVVEAEPVRLPDDDAEAAPDFIQRGLEAIQDRRRVGSALLAVLLLIVAIYVLFPKVVGFKGTLASIGRCWRACP